MQTEPAEGEWHQLEDRIKAALGPDYGPTLHKVIVNVNARLAGHPADEIYDAIVEEASVDLPDFQPDRAQLMEYATEIQDGVLRPDE